MQMNNAMINRAVRTDARYFINTAGIERDQRIVAKLMSGDEQTEGDFVREHIVWMRPLARKYVTDQSTADDVVQDAFASAFRAMASYQGRSTLKTWLHRITVNAALMKLRKIKRLAECDIDEHQPQFDSDDARVEAPFSVIATPEDILDSEERKNMVLSAVARLPENYRIVLQLRDIEERDTMEVAQILGLSESNVKVRLHRARAALRGLLEPEFNA